MTRQIRVRGIRRKEIDSAKLAIAFLMLAKILHDQERQDDGHGQGRGEVDADRSAS